MGYNATDGTANALVHVDFGNGGFEFTWFANPTPPPYWDANYMEHGYNRVYANGTYIHMQVTHSHPTFSHSHPTFSPRSSARLPSTPR